MIAKLTGTLDETGPDWAVIDVAGVGYLVHCSAKTLAALGYYAQTQTFAEIGYDGPWLGRIEAPSRVTHEAPVDLATVLAARQAR